MNGRYEGKKQTYRAWVEEGARGFFLAPAIAVNAVRLINPLDQRGGFFVRRDTSDAQQRERRALLKIADHEDGERDDHFGRASRIERAESRHRHVIAYDNEPPAGPPDRMAAGEPWVVTARVERAAEVVRRGWLTWETEGEVITARRAENAENRMNGAHRGESSEKGERA